MSEIKINEFETGRDHPGADVPAGQDGLAGQDRPEESGKPEAKEAPKAVYRIERYITDTDADLARRQKLSSMFCMFQDISALHAANLGASVAWLKDVHNVAWILMRVRLEIDKYPVLAQDVYVESWPQETRALYERDNVIRCRESGETLVRAASTWIIMNLDTREIKRDQFFTYQGVEIKKERAIDGGVRRLKPSPGAELIYEKEIKFSDVDYNGHVNNAKYVDYIMDSFSFAEHRAREVKAIEMHYINEIGPGDVLQIRRKEVGDGVYYLDGVRAADGAQVINSLVEWGK